MSSSLKKQTVGGYVSEYANKHKCSSLQAIQSAMCKEFIKMRKNEENSHVTEIKGGN